MNLRETQQLLTMLWSLYPNAPKLSKDDKSVMAMAWLSVLYEYSRDDVWQAAKICIAAEPRFLPTAPEILKRCEKSLSVEHYLPREYVELTSQIDMSIEAERERRQLIRIMDQCKDLDAEDKALYAKVKGEQAILKKINEMWKTARETAENVYAQAERAKLYEDGTAERLKQLSILA